MNRLQSMFGRQVDASTLGLFRIVWGVLMFLESVTRLKGAALFSSEYFHFHYEALPFVAPLPEVWMARAEIIVMAVSALLVAAGLLFRVAAPLFTLLYAHLFLLDKVYYNNHYYLTILVSLLLAMTSADRAYSVRRLWQSNDSSPPLVPLWNLILLRGQVIVMYVFGGIAKLNSDWLQGEPVRYWMTSKKGLIEPLSWMAREEWFTWLVVYTGLILDLSAGFLLLRGNRVVFGITAAVLVAFHLTNDQLFNIGFFPYIGMALILPFLDPARPRIIAATVRSWFGGAPQSSPGTGAVTASQPAPAIVVWLVIGYLALQALLPLRYFLYGRDVDWTEFGELFSWRMMLRQKDAQVWFVFDPPSAETVLQNSPHAPRLASAHIDKLARVPQFILQYVHAMRAALAEEGMPGVKIRVLSVASLNGRPFQLMIEPDRDLTQETYGFGRVPDWIVRLQPDQKPGAYVTDLKQRSDEMLKVADDDVKRKLGIQ